VIEGQIVARCAVLADEAVAQEDIEAGEGGVSGRLDEGFQRNDAWELHLEGGTTYRPVIMLDNVHAIEKDRLDRVLPRPKRQRVVTQRPEIRIQHQHRPTALRDMCVQITLLTPILAAKQHVLTYYMQRDGIVKSLEQLIPGASPASDAHPEPPGEHQILGRERMRRWLGVLIAAFLALGWSLRCAAEDYPTRPITMIVPFPAGGATDTVARFLAE